MSDTNTLSSRVLDSLVGAGLLTVEQLASVTEQAATRGVGPGTVLAERGLVSAADVASVLEHEMGVPSVDLSSYAPEDAALALVPASVARSRRMLPLFDIEGMLTVAIGDAMDVFMLDALAADLDMELEPVLADAAAVESAITTYYGDAAESAPAAPPLVARGDEMPPPPPVAEVDAGEPGFAASDFFEEQAAPFEPTMAVPVAPVAEFESIPTPVPLPAETIEQMAGMAAPGLGRAAIDLDVLAVADSRRIAVLVTEILEDAVAREASMIHLLPYKDDFFLVYRVKGGLEKVASAPLSLQGALVDGLKSFAKMSGVQASRPALSRVRARVGDKDLVVTVSAVPTIAGQRLVVSLASHNPEPSGLAELGMSEAEVRALHAMVERGRGILLVCAPVAAGASTTYYALLAHAASTGKTVYSVEHSVEYEIPAVAQVMINTASPVPAANYLAAGLKQDTDVVAIDGLRTVEDVHLAVEAAGLGKLVIATFPAADIASGVRRMLDLGVEPHSLASALTVGVGQRLVRMNCPNCTVETPSGAMVRIPGVTADDVNRTGTGCPNCGKTGFRGAVGIFEVLPFTEPVRAKVATGASASEIAAAADAAGMRPLAASGLARMRSGAVSADELDRVLRFS
ncbi:MAG: Flp pilus assembly complex ATPase component TadA [Actinomycetia bacterium]|nr:Flp pilus assembly complex ATPase component TadA [Actinomycetes bacterium]